MSLFLALYVATKFVLVIFGATDPTERWPFDLTPFGALNLPDIQLAFLAALAAGANAFLHYSAERTHRAWSIALGASMVAGLILALRVSSANLDAVNVARFSILILVLATVCLDHVELLRTAPEPPESFVESELAALREPSTDVAVTPWKVKRALKELEALVGEFPEGPAPAHAPGIAEAKWKVAETKPEPAAAPAPEGTSVAASDEEYMRQLLASVLEEHAGEDETARPTPGVAHALPEPLLDEVPMGEEPAATLIDRLASLFPRSWRAPDVLLAEARELADRGKLEKALRRLDRVADFDAHYPGLWQLAAEIYERMGEVEEAAECRRRAVEGIH